MINTVMSQNLLLILLCLCFAVSLTHASNDHQRKTYIVYMGELSESKPASSVLDDHHNLLLSAIGDERVARESKIHSYGKSFNAFAARLMPHEATRLMDKENVVSVFESTTRELHTTRSWSFLGMPHVDSHRHHLQTPKRKPNAESDLIIGILDTGIYIDAPSFNDKGFEPPPTKWKGSCAKAVNFTGCNNKVIGAKAFKLDKKDPSDADKSPVDVNGHGTHTASTAAGVPVKGASLYGVAQGTARGGVPRARVAAYKVCWGVGCSDVDLLAGFDEAIADGVDVISVSVGGPSRHFFVDVISIGSFHAMKRGILTACSAGNAGPDDSSVENVSPWILTVGASSVDRKFVTQVRFGNGKKAYGMSINTFSPRKKSYPLISGAQATKNGSSGNASACEYGTLGDDKVKGKIVYCLGSSSQDSTINLLGGVGTIMSTTQESDTASTTLIPASIVTFRDGTSIAKYINSTKNPTAVIYRTTTANMTAPFVASFSSRGPQKITPNILKPDVAAPGLNILAAYSKLNSITGSSRDKRYTTYNIMSGTSMACPHATAAAVYVKSFHPDWSPSAIKSALMTTATPMKIQEMGAELGSGSGQINPTAAIDPGLVYDLRMSYYLRFLCTQGYNSTTIGLLLGGKKKYNCSGFKPALGLDGLNYPSMHINLGRSDSDISAVFYRTVTNVGHVKSVYKAKVKSPKDLSIQVIPRILEFDHPNQRQSFKVKVKGRADRNGTQVVTATLEWTDSKHTVRSPIVVYKEAFH